MALPRRPSARSSAGGLAWSCAALRHPQGIGSVPSQSGSVERGQPGGEGRWLARQYAAVLQAAGALAPWGGAIEEGAPGSRASSRPIVIGGMSRKPGAASSRTARARAAMIA